MAKPYSKQDLMKQAIAEHLKCKEFPRVGVVVAKAGQILATGYRGEIPQKHAERVALEKLTMAERLGATVFTTLEPCVSLHEDQATESCADLIIASGVTDVVIGVLDPNGTIYSQGFRKLLENNIGVSFFSQKLRQAVEEETFDFGSVSKIVGHGKRRVPVVHSGLELTVQFSETDLRAIKMSWQTLQPSHGTLDLSSENGAVTVAAGARHFGDITDPGVFRFPKHFARMTKDTIAVVRPAGATFCVLVKLLEIFENDILFQWEMRNCN